MKKVLLSILFLTNITLYPTTLNGKFVVFNSSDTSAGIKLQINSDMEKEDLGGATLVIRFDTVSLSFSNPPAENDNYTFHNFSGGNYERASLTKVLPDELWINIELLADDQGIPVSGPEGWTDVVTIYFRKRNDAGSFWVRADTNSLYWGVFDADNMKIWNTGDFRVENLLSDNKEIDSPGNFELSQNYPNPFNPSTKIIFKLRSGGMTRLILYDLLGNEIERIIDGEMAPGSYEAEVDGSMLASGIYIYTLKVEGKFSEAKKMVLLK